MSRDKIQRVARMTALGWAAAGALLYVGLNGGSPLAQQAADRMLLAGLVFLATAVAATRYELIGGSLLVAEGLIALLGGVDVSAGRPLMAAAVGLPPVLAGWLFIESWMRGWRETGSSQAAVAESHRA